jgi:hypothetical protein
MGLVVVCGMSLDAKFVVTSQCVKKIGVKTVRKKKSVKAEHKQKPAYSEGDLNRLIDSIFHPLYRKNEAIRLVDGLLHALVEQDPPVSAKKFLIYNVSELVKKASRRKC